MAMVVRGRIKLDPPEMSRLFYERSGLQPVFDPGSKRTTVNRG